MNQHLSTEAFHSTVARHWYHKVLVGEEVVTVWVRPAGLGYKMEAEASSPDVAASAIGTVAQNPRGDK